MPVLRPVSKTSLAGLLAACMGVFLLALVLRLHYQANAEEMSHLRGDAVKYFTAAFNLRIHGAHSLDRPSLRSAPTTRTDLSPGYPLFLALFFDDPPDSRVIKPRVQIAQAIIGALTCVGTLLLGVAFLPISLSAVAALLLALSPHHISLTEVMLTETLFTFLLITGLACVVHGWLHRWAYLFLVGVLCLAMAVEVRLIGLVVIAALAGLALLFALRRDEATYAASPRLAGAAALALALVYGTHLYFSSTSMTVGGDTNAVNREYTNIGSPLGYLARGATPPRFYVADVSHIVAENGDAELRYPTEKPFSEAPGAYLLWNCCARWFYGWHFDNAYAGGAEFYPMSQSGFADAPVLRSINTLMRWLHWPIFVLALLSVVQSLVRLKASREAMESTALILSTVFLVFFAAVNTVLWIPRYSVPTYPLAYLLVMAFALRVLRLRSPARELR